MGSGQQPRLETASRTLSPVQTCIGQQTRVRRGGVHHVLPPLRRQPGGPPLRPPRRPPVLHQVLRECFRQQLRRVRQDHRHRQQGSVLQGEALARGLLPLQQVPHQPRRQAVRIQGRSYLLWPLLRRAVRDTV